MSQSTSAESNNKEVQGITKISVQGFKSLYDECSIEIRPLTILAGANSSGKSSIMQPLLLMKQTLEAPYDPGALLLNGSNVKFTLAKQLLSCVSRTSNQFKIKLQFTNDYLIENIFQLSKDIGIDIVRTEFHFGNGRIWQISIDGKNKEIIDELQLQKYLDKAPRRQKNELDSMFPEPHLKEGSVKRVRCFLEPKNLILFKGFSEKIRQVIHVPGLRGNPERQYPTTAIGDEFPGTFENYIANIINFWHKNEDFKLQKLAEALKTLGLTSKIDTKQMNDVQIELRVGRLSGIYDANDMVSIADVGIGVSQVLPVLVALLVAKPGQLVYIEQPELHLHPRAQAALANILADAAKRGVRVVIETHSELLLLAVQSLVAERQLSPDLVKLHWFTRGDDGMTKISSADLDEAGAFGDFPEDFSDVSLKLESRYLNAAESRLSEGSSGR
ncbi:MAG: AAA family ATPase [Coleofasciculus sp. G1-WW12-02]|uniref:AAA family ATPase n=1 Tax=Coleofasciculus sp. G1-WW12-02 TaxID=3068483 RepID=UPI0032FDDC49